ncbi:CHAT domain-containing protein [Methanosarcina hadiensis]|uniref:CHAT domain-containing protein n=1 Tax=Methanosarcina hadiensis TaxID=3078083 RepID=UPI003977BB32
MGFWSRLFGTNKKDQSSILPNEVSIKDLQLILVEIDSLWSPNSMPRKIMLLRHALSLVQCKSSPKLWAVLQVILGDSLYQNPQGDMAENLEQAIESYNRALEVYTRKDFPADWVETQNNLANAYFSRIKGDKAENLEKAIVLYNRTLEVYTHKDFAAEWALIQFNVANVYRARIRGDRAGNLEQAIEHYNKALKVYTQNIFSAQWALTQKNLGEAYRDRVWGDRAENLEHAIKLYNMALEVYTRKGFPADWAMIQNSLGLAYSSRIRGDKAENLEQSIEHYNMALKVYTRKSFPKDWAETQNNLGNAYRDRVWGDISRNIGKAISHYHSALEIYKLESMPHDFLKTCRLLGDLYFDTEQWGNAAESYKDAIKADGLLYRSGLSAGSKSIEAGKNACVFRNAALAAYRMNLENEALITFERGKVRLLNEASGLKMKKPGGVPDTEWAKYEQAVEMYRNAIKLSTRKDYALKEKSVQETLKDLCEAEKVVQAYNPGFQKELETLDILSVLDDETAILTFCITDKGSIGFLISELNSIQSAGIPDFKTKDLNRLLFNADDQGNIKGGWVGSHANYQHASETYYHYVNEYVKEKTTENKEQFLEAHKNYESIFKEWQNTLNEVLSIIGHRLLSPLLVELPPQIKRLILLPSGGLFLLPLHAVPLSDGQPLCQRYCISYVPSIPLLKEMQNDAMTTEGKSLYAVINPQEDPALAFSGCEGQAISRLFESSQVNVGKTGTKTAVLKEVPGKAYLHFSCHGSYIWDDPAQSGLYLAGGQTLSLSDLQNDEVNISSTRLVTLSACETGVASILIGNADEFVGLPAGFMLAGVPCVVSSLWSVPDISTAMLMEQFYSNHIVEGMDIPEALQEAQLWVRDLTSRQVTDYMEKCYYSGKWEGKSKENIEQYIERYLKLAEESPEKKPFQHPYYWAAFTVNGE